MMFGGSSEKELSKKRWALFLIGLCCFITNMCFSARDGYLAIFANSQHISGFVYGLFKGNYIVGYVLMGVMNKAVLKCCSARVVILVGLFGHGVCLLLAGVIYTVLLEGGPVSPSQKTLFEFLTCLLQAIQGGLMSSVTLSSLSLGTAYLKDQMNIVNGTYYLGAVIPHGVVPVIANVIYNQFGYSTPLYLFSLLSVLLSILAWSIFISKDFDFSFDAEDESGSLGSLPPRCLIPLVQSYILTAYLSYLQLALPKFAHTVVGFGVVTASTTLLGLMLSIALVNVLITFLWGTTRRILLLLLLCCIVDMVAASLLFPPLSAPAGWIAAARYYIYPLLAAIGMSDAFSTINTTPAMVELYETARPEPPSPSQRHTMSSLWIAGNGLSYAVGAYLAGFMDQVFAEDFGRASVFWGSLAGVCVVSLLLPLVMYEGAQDEERYKLCETDPRRSGEFCER